MKKLISILLMVFITVNVIGQEQTITKEGTYTVTDSDFLEATNYIVLKPYTLIRPEAGHSFIARIVQPGSEEPPYVDSIFDDENYVFTRVFQKEMTAFNPNNAQEGDVIESIGYFDGLGRPMQQVAIKATPDYKDLVTHIGYDGYGRQEKEWLPYRADGANGTFRTNAEASTNSFYYDMFPDDLVQNDENPYSQKEFEVSPLSRVLEQAAPGEDWKLGNGHEIRFDYQTNENGEVRIFGVTLTEANDTYTPSLVDGNSFYGAGELQKTVTKDENWQSGQTHPNDHTTEEFTDKQGRVVLKRTYNQNIEHDTYYVYDDYGNLTYVIPPKVVLEDQPDAISTSELSELCYQYKYDHRNRLVEKKIPGKGWEYIVYNKLDQPIMTQDANLKSNNQWLLTKYDIFGRVAYTGIIYLNSSRISAQTIANSTSNQFEVASPTSTTIDGKAVFYSNSSFPSNSLSHADSDLHTINYYDSYKDLDGITVPSNVLGQQVTQNVQGLSTVSKVRVLGEVDWITTVSAYDNKGRAIYSHSKNPYLETEDIIETKLDFVGKVLKTKTTHIKGNNSPIVTIDNFEYDHMGRLKKQEQELASNTELIAANTYDELGQLVQKDVGNNALDPLQEVDYGYNIRGWLRTINDVTNSIPDKLFNFKIGYNEGSQSLFNGNISNTEWKTKNDDNKKGYFYTYDALNRLKNALSVGSDFSGRYDVSPVNYDKNGNITYLKRRGHTNVQASSFGVMDQLAYIYDGNKLKSVDDHFAASANTGFVDGVEMSNEYSYDQNGNMISDLNKGITGIEYNHLNLPTKVTVSGSGGNGNIQYVYAADGTKLKKTISGGTEMDYASGYVYENNILQFFPHPEGYVSVENGNYSYVYQYKDHLGNVRLSYTEDPSNPGSPTIIEENNYYPFGLEHKGYNNVVTSTNPAQNYTYNGKEKQEELGLNWHDYGARNYDAALGRWMNIDPLAEKYPHFTPYHYVYNNPINFIDPDGEEGIVVSGQPGDHKNKAHFLANGYNKALAAQGKVQDKNEKVTWIVYNDGSESAGHSPAMLKEYRKKAEKAGINFKVVSKAGDIVDYINNKTGGDSRKNDKISSFYYVGHATPGDLDVGYGGSGENFEPDDLDGDAFRSGAWVNCVGGCRTAIAGMFEDSVVTQFAEILDELSTVYGVDVRVYYSGGVQSDEAIAKKNKGKIEGRKGELPAKKKEDEKKN